MLPRPPPPFARDGSDTCVQGTNDDAQISKLSCARAGYFKDDFIHFFVRKHTRRSPLINRGYFSRYAALRRLLLRFLELTVGQPQQGAQQDQQGAQRAQHAQVLVLGAGFDTTWFGLAQDGAAPPKWLEVDFKEVTSRKAATIKNQPALLGLISAAAKQHSAARQDGGAGAGSSDGAPAGAPPTDGVAVAVKPDAAGGASSAPLEGSATVAGACITGTSSPAAAAAAAPPDCSETVAIDVHAGEVVSERYCLLPVDLRNLDSLGTALQRAGFDLSAPTYVLAECVLVYMEPAHSAALVRWLGQHLSTAAMVVYEQIKPDDAFGRQMVSNLESRGCPLKGLPATPTLEAHRRRFLDNGWQHALSQDMDRLYTQFIDPKERARMERLEVFDEFEEWHMIQEHYSITVGVNDAAHVLSGLGLGGNS